MKQNGLVYQPDCQDSGRWEHTMFQPCDPPPRLPSWQDYFTSDDPNSFLYFLHYYEPKLTRVASSFVYRYALYDQLADVKMVCVEELLQQMWALDSFRWYDDDQLDEDGNEIDIGIAGSDILGYTKRLPPEPTAIRSESQRLVTEAYEELTELEQEVIGLHLGFCGNCFCRLEAKTYDEIADIYQFGTENGALKFYHRALDKLRTILDRKGMFYPARLLWHLARKKSLPADRVFPLPPDCVDNTLWLKSSAL